MADKNNGEWDYYFGRGGSGNVRRKLSKGNSLAQKLALRYSECRPSDRRIFALKEIYEVVIKNGGKFYQIIDKKFVDITMKEVEVLLRIMQGLRDVNKHCKTAPLSPRSTLSPSSPRKGKESSPRKKKKTVRKGKESSPRKKKKTPPIGLKIRKVPLLKRGSSITPVRRLESTCVKPSIVEAPIIECVSDALKHQVSFPVLNGENDSVVSREKQQISFKTDNDNEFDDGSGTEVDPEADADSDSSDINVAKTSSGIVGAMTSALKVDGENSLSGGGGARQELYGSEDNDVLERMAAEPPKLENSFSALIMADEITADLPTDSQKNINQSLHARVQRLENLVAMLMQQKNEDLERLL